MTTELRGKSAIVGTGHAGLGEAHGLTAYDVMAQSALAALGDAGRHARSAVSAASLPLGVAVEIEAIFEIG